MATPEEIQKLVFEKLGKLIEEQGSPTEIDEAFVKALFEGIPTPLVSENDSEGPDGPGGEIPFVPMRIIFGPPPPHPIMPIASPPPAPPAPLHSVQLPSMGLQFNVKGPSVRTSAPLPGMAEPSGVIQGQATSYLHTFKELPDYTLFQILDADQKGYVKALFYDKVVRPHERNDGEWITIPINIY
ncbi:hypothetical protein Clacol_009588 [Clathrus columnatus]|uniref:SH3 domain-containing protein n=1 Tax=Clathrus columnatus TaxID=1419009 RepID=A0AAV5ANH6_9AGAM|nr:hypothetical protein Clacol_009588 [Clathrus columnatus]